MTGRKVVLQVSLFLAFVLSTSLCSFGQATYGNVIGTVTDPEGAVIPGAKINIQNVGTGVATDSATDESGNYVITHLLPGTYTVMVSQPGFQSAVQKNVTVAVGSSARVDAVLQVGKVSQDVTVSAALAVSCLN